MSDAPVAAKGWWEGMKPVNFQWTVLRCDIQVAQELNRGGARVIPDLLQAPLPIFKRRESDNARKMREGGGSSFKIKKGKTLRGTVARRIASIASRPRLLGRHYRRAFIDRAFRPSSLFIVGAHCQRAKAGESVTFPPADRPEIRPAT